jgi:hypothetical protein
MSALRRRGTAAAALAALGCLAASAPVHAAVAKPVPCGDQYIYDDAGDAYFDPTGLQTSSSKKLGHAAGDNADMTSFFFTYGKDARGFPAVFANVKVVNLTRTPPALTDSQGGLFWDVVYLWNGTTRYVRARLDPLDATMSYSSGTIDPAKGTYSGGGTTTGTLFEGKGGVVQIRVPPGAGGRLGETLGAGVATADYVQGAGFSLLNFVDEAPDGASTIAPNGLDYTVRPCTTTATAR